MGAATQMTPLSQTDSRSLWAASYTGSQHWWGPSMGTLGPFSWKKGRKKALHNAAPSRSGSPHLR